MAALFDIAEASQGSPYNLNVIWVTSGFAGSLKESKAKDGTDTGIRRLSNLLLHARIRLYTIDPQGVKPLGATAVATPIAKSRTGRDGVQSASDSAAEEALASQGAAYEPNQFLSLLTGMMGGRSYFGRNDIEIAFSQAMADGVSNYSLSYAPSNGDFHGEYRKIEIRTDVEGAKARTRLGYYAIADEPPLTPEMREAKWKAALSSPLAYEGFALSCPLTYDASAHRAVGVLTVKPTELGMQMEQQSREVIRVAAISKSGSTLAEWAWQIDWKKPWNNRVTTANFDKPLPAKANAVRFLVSEPSAQQIGTCDYRLPPLKGNKESAERHSLFQTKCLPALGATTTAAATSAAAATTTFAASTKPATAAFARRFWSGFVDVQDTAIQFRPIQMRNRGLCLPGIAHFNECEAPRLAGVPVGHNVHAFHAAILCESGVQLVLRRSITEIAHKNVGHSVIPFSRLSLTDCAETNWNRWKKSGRKQTRII